MKPKQLTLNTPVSDAVFAMLAAVIGLVVRLPAPLRATFPLNDGGLFYQMILDLQANHFRLPLFTTYNSGNIPFAYPPFAFYFVGFLASAFHIDVLTLLRIIPPIISSLSIPAFYYLTRRILKSGQETVLAAALAFALTPRGFEWQIMGGGITRSFGLLFALLALRSLYILFTEHTPRSILITAIWGTLTVLSHPEAAAQTALAALILFLVLDRSFKGAIYAIAATGVIVFLSAPWWATMLTRYGFGPYLAAAAAARDGTFVDFPARIALTFQFNFTEEFYLPLIAFLGLIGLFVNLARREFLLPLWVTLPLFFEPRSAPQFMVIPLGMLAGIGLTEVLWPALKKLSESQSRATKTAAGGFIVYLLIYLLLSAYLVASNVANSVTLQPSDRSALAWVRAEAPVNSRFIVITGAGAVTDPLAEWFPALAQRRSLNTIFGLEWVRDISFRKQIEQYYALQSCLNQDESCLANWARDTGLEFSHVIFHKRPGSDFLLSSLRDSTNYRLAYENQTVAIFERLP